MFGFNFGFGGKKDEGPARITLADLEVLKVMADIIVQGVEGSKQDGELISGEAKKALAMRIMKAAVSEANLPVPNLMMDAAIEAGVSKLFPKKAKPGKKR